MASSVVVLMALAWFGLVSTAGAAVAPRLAASACDARASDVSHAWGNDEKVAVDLKAIEVDLDDDDDDDDPLWHVVGHAPAFRWAPGAPRPAAAERGALPIDTSRFVAGIGLPRGPPV
ncbi:MAG: hypothetical protein KIT84_10815 [Labilithrix sp.]|nr:hypothetical protein [Labilithrix sp.]MCW5811498.1 hypothetical protein [Labilithrix sp.]